MKKKIMNLKLEKKTIKKDDNMNTFIKKEREKYIHIYVYLN